MLLISVCKGTEVERLVFADRQSFGQFAEFTQLFRQAATNHYSDVYQEPPVEPIDIFDLNLNKLVKKLDKEVVDKMKAFINQGSIGQVEVSSTETKNGIVFRLKIGLERNGYVRFDKFAQDFQTALA